jgi:hypothetical protein
MIARMQSATAARRLMPVSLPAMKVYFIVVLLAGMTVFLLVQSTLKHFSSRFDQLLSLAKQLARDNDSRSLKYQSPQAGLSRWVVQGDRSGDLTDIRNGRLTPYTWSPSQCRL